MEKLTLTIEKAQYQINRDALRVLIVLGVVTEIVAPPKPDVVTPKPLPATAVPESDFLGEQIESNLFRMKGQDCNLLRADGKLWPRATATNPNPNGHIGVPRQFVLPEGWYWEAAASGDGAWAIVPYPTTQPGPEWLRSTIAKIDVPTSIIADQAGETDTNFLTSPQ